VGLAAASAARTQTSDCPWNAYGIVAQLIVDPVANKDFRYLTKTYLPKKLKERDWLD
jgi:hypothetical protein